jgi:hypothetical protein
LLTSACVPESTLRRELPCGGLESGRGCAAVNLSEALVAGAIAAMGGAAYVCTSGTTHDLWRIGDGGAEHLAMLAGVCRAIAAWDDKLLVAIGTSGLVAIDPEMPEAPTPVYTDYAEIYAITVRNGWVGVSGKSPLGHMTTCVGERAPTDGFQEIRASCARIGEPAPRALAFAEPPTIAWSIPVTQEVLRANTADQEPLVLFNGSPRSPTLEGPAQLAVVADAVVFSLDDTVWQVALSGTSAPRALAVGDTKSGLLHDGQALYWLDDTARELVRLDLPSGETHIAANDLVGPALLAQDDDAIYIAPSAGGVWRVKKTSPR